MRKWWNVLTVCIVIWVSGADFAVVFGQADDPLANISYGAEVIFPAALSFSLQIPIPREELTSLELYIGQGDLTLVSSRIEIDEYLLSSAPVTIIRYIWMVDLAEPPEVFAPILYRWTVTGQSGNSQVVEDEIIFQPQSEDWRLAGEPPLEYHLLNQELNIVAANQRILPALERMQMQTGVTIDYQWVVLPRGFQFCVESENDAGEPVTVAVASFGEAFPCDEESALDIFAAYGYRVLERQMPGLIPFQNEVIDALYAIHYTRYWRNSDVPGWFYSGLRQLYHVISSPLAVRLTQEASRAGALFGSEMLDAAPENEEARIAWDQQAYTLVLYLADAYGAEAPFDLAEASTNRGFQEAFGALTDSTFDDFLVDWERWLLTDRAEQAAAWTIYLLPTPTDLPTRTSTPVPPTSTATSTASATPPPSATSTATSRVIQIASPLPTYTPFTPESPVPSNTPRPPGSLDRPAARDDGNGGGICPAALPGLLLPAVALVLGQRRKGKA